MRPTRRKVEPIQMMTAIEYNDPRRIAEAAEEIEVPAEDLTAISEAMTRLMSWCLEARSPGDVGFRVYAVAYVLYPQLLNGVSLEQIAKLRGHGRSAVNRHTSKVAEILGVRGQLQKSETHRKAQSKRWKVAHGCS